ncbi:MAG: response regulator [Pseudomonas sp.]|uniref:response regulator n=1 Tax=Pseudomonas sp. TaxID=306 RepID=UPI00121863C9|nr:response regulator [Pseudomonas sp.]RZI73307.1 MAG: response regulator [Pseudomonas sp.]
MALCDTALSTDEGGLLPHERKAPILLVDDDERNLLALSQILEDTAEIVTASSGADALRHLLKRDFAVILLDVYMPDMDGYEVARIIRDRQQTARIPIVFLSAVNKDAEHLLRGYGMGAVDYVFKPVDPLALRSKVATFADLYRMRLQVEAKSRAEQELREANFRAQLERLEVERELQESRSRLAVLLDALPIAFYEANVAGDGQFTRHFIGGDLARLAGPLASEVESGAIQWEDRIHPDDRAMLTLAERNPGGSVSFEYRWSDHDGLGRHFMDQCVRLPRPDGTERWVGTLIDISERKQLEAKLVQTGKLEAIGQLTGGVAHDFNNLLAAILGGINVLERRVTFGEREQTVMQHMRHAAQNGVELVRRMMAFARKQDLRPELVNPQQLCTSVSGLVEHTLGGTVAVEWSCAEQGLQLFVDAAQLELALVNLIINARDAMPGGGTVQVRVGELDQASQDQTKLAPGDYLSIQVIDQGMGIPSGIIERVTEPFFTTKAVGKGTGLGLSMVMGFAQQSGGRLNIKSVVGSGTVIDMILPAKAESTGVTSVQVGAAPIEVSDVRRTVLLVDDDQAVREVLTHLLEDLGFDVLAAPNGLKALELLASPDARVDVLLTDFAMPGITGAETILRARQIRPGVPAVMMTGYADDRISIAALRGTTILRKPVEGAELRAVLDRHLISHRTTGEEIHLSNPPEMTHEGPS